MEPAGGQPRAGAPTWYRSDQDRNKSLRQRANPWHRRLARSAVAACLLTALGAGLYFGAIAVQNYVGRDRLPGAGAEVPEIRTTSFLIRSSSPGPIVDGTLTIDTASRAFTFVGRATGVHAGIEVVSPNGSSAYVRRPPGNWALLTDTAAADAQLSRDDLLRVVRYLSNDDTADAILTNRVRRGYVDLVAQTTEGTDDNERTRYELEIDTLEFSTDAPLDWQTFLQDAIPDAPEVQALHVVIWLDAENVLVRVSNDDSNWSWERLAYSAQPFVPEDPALLLIEETTAISAEAGNDATTPTPTTTTGG